MVPEVFLDFCSSRDAPNMSREARGETRVHRFAALSLLSNAEKNLGKPLGPGYFFVGQHRLLIPDRAIILVISC